MGNGLLSERLCLFSVGAFAVAATLLSGPAAAQDYDAGKTGPQLFASDCSACHRSPGGLAKGRDRGSLTSFLTEHYTSKRASAQLLAAFLLGAGPGDAKQDRADVPGGPKAKTRRADREEEPKGDPKLEPKPEPKPRAELASENREEPQKRTRAEDREAPKGEAAAVLSKLKYYGSARGPAKDTARLALPERRLESYANSGASTIAPPAPPANRRTPQKKKNTDASASAGPKPAQQRPAGNN
jgi:hypothetical protein